MLSDINNCSFNYFWWVGFPVLFVYLNILIIQEVIFNLLINWRVTMILVLGLYLFFSNKISLINLSLDRKSIVSFFHSVSTRTPGFNTVDLSLFNTVQWRWWYINDYWCLSRFRWRDENHNFWCDDDGILERITSIISNRL